ncbi:MAG: nidogen-like domain-containing protein, partial [bacterium]
IDTQKTSNPIFQRLFTYDQSGNLTQEYSDATGTTAFANYTYDTLNRLTGIDYTPGDYKDITYTYDKVGNRVTSQVQTEPVRNYGYTSNCLKSDGVYSYDYYPNGNLKSKSGQGEVITYYYDYENNLIMIGKNGFLDERYVYDGNNSRVEKIKGEAITIYHYDLQGRTLCEMKGKTEVKQIREIDYSILPSDFQWITTTQATDITGDDQTILFNLPFKFKFYGQEYDKVYVCSNGFLSFTSDSNSWSPVNIPNSNQPNALVAPFWRDLDPRKGGKITYESNPERFIVSWDNISLYSPRGNYQTFQVILNKDGTITFQYKDLQGVDERVVVGIENQAGNEGEEYDRNLLENCLALKIQPLTGKEAIPKEEVEYELLESNYQWIETESPTEITGDDDNKWFNLPFTFRYYDKTYDKININSNGFLSFDGGYATQESYCPTNIPDTRAPNNMIGVFWRDLDPSEEGKISYEDLGDRFVVSWQDVSLYGRSEKETFQVILHYDGRIVLQYKTLQGVDGYVKVGIENSQGRNGVAIPLASIRDGKAFELNLIVTKIESPPAQKVTITSKTSYVYGNGQLVAKLQEEPIGSSPKVYYYHNDHLGSPRAISDKDGKVVENYFYYPFGSGGPVGRPSFTGKELDATGLFYFGARYYDPALGRFITPDPIDLVGSNPYLYCDNNPLTYVDPNGEFGIFAAFIVGAIFGGVSTAIAGGDWDDILKGAFIGGISSMLTYGIAFAGAEAGAGSALSAEAIASNRVIASGITQVIMSTDPMQELVGDNFLLSAVTSAFIQSGIESGLNWDKNVSLLATSEEEVKNAIDPTKGGKFIQAKVSGRYALDEGMHGFKKVVRGNDVLGYVSHDKVLGKIPLTTHTGVITRQSITSSFASRFRYIINGVCHQDVGRALGIAPTQLFTKQIDVWLTMGVYGTTGGPGALPAYLLIQYERYR